MTSSELAIIAKPGSGSELSVWDRKLLEIAAQYSGSISPEELSIKVGGTPAQCANRLKEILASRDWLSTVERKALLMEDLVNLKVHLTDMVNNKGYHWDGRFYSIADPRWSAQLLKVIQEISRQIDYAALQLEDAKTTVRAAHGKLMIRALEMAFREFVNYVHQQAPELDENKLRDALEREILPRAFDLVEEATA